MKRLDDRDPRVLAILLASLHDYTPGPAVDRRNPLSVRQPAASSWAPSGYELCPDCDLDGTVKRGKHRVICPRCKGAGCWPVDGYDTAAKPLQVLNGDADVGRAARQLCDLTLPELDRALARLENAADKDEDALWVALQKQARFRTGQRWAQQLEAGMRRLPSFDQALLEVGLVSGWFPERFMGQPLRWRLVVALQRLAVVLPDTFKAPRPVIEQASAEHAAEQARTATAEGRWCAPADRDARDREVRRLSSVGWSDAAIERRLKVSRRTIARILDEREAA